MAVRFFSTRCAVLRRSAASVLGTSDIASRAAVPRYQGVQGLCTARSSTVLADGGAVCIGPCDASEPAGSVGASLGGPMFEGFDQMLRVGISQTSLCRSRFSGQLTPGGMVVPVVLLIASRQGCESEKLSCHEKLNAL